MHSLSDDALPETLFLSPILVTEPVCPGPVPTLSLCSTRFLPSFFVDRTRGRTR